jgi:hypothetical protein
VPFHGIHTGSNPVPTTIYFCWGFAKLVKASDFDSDTHRFKSYIPCHSVALAAQIFVKRRTVMTSDKSGKMMGS